MRLFRPLTACLLLALGTFGCQQSDDLNPSGAGTPRFESLDRAFTDYEVVTLAVDELLTQSADNKTGGFVLDLDLPNKPNWVFTVQYHDFYDADYQAFESDANGDWVEVVRTGRSDAFHGQSVDKQSRAMFIMEDEHLSGEIYEGDVQYGLEPLSQYEASAPRDQYVYYRLDADIAAMQADCGNDGAGHDDAPANVPLKAAQCRDMSVTYVADYAYYQKFGNNTANTRSFIENRLRYGSYRYWGYNEYPLYFRLYASYVQTNDSNTPATSSDSRTFLSQWRDWGNSGNIGRADENVLFTGKDFGGLFGIAYVGQVCRQVSGNNQAFAMVTKIDRISSAVYSKVTGHEVGHNLGAGHQDTGFMKQGNHTNTSMPQATRNDLDAHIGQYNSCMGLRDCVAYDG